MLLPVWRQLADRHQLLLKKKKQLWRKAFLTRKAKQIYRRPKYFLVTKNWRRKKPLMLLSVSRQLAERHQLLLETAKRFSRAKFWRKKTYKYECKQLAEQQQLLLEKKKWRPKKFSRQKIWRRKKHTNMNEQNFGLITYPTAEQDGTVPDLCLENVSRAFVSKLVRGLNNYSL